MTTLRGKSEEIRSYILQNLDQGSLALKVAERFNISRQAAHRHLLSLVREGALSTSGKTRSRSYQLAATHQVTFRYVIDSKIAEDEAWRRDIVPILGSVPDNVLAIWNFAFTEMFNNAIDHSGGNEIVVSVTQSAVDTEIAILDNGVGIFRKIKDALSLSDEKQAIFELCKGKLTTDARNHSGEGIFFTSRMVDAFDILSGDVFFSHEIGHEVAWMSDQDKARSGTAVFLKVKRHTTRTVRGVYAKWRVGDTFSFNKTVVPVKLAKYGTDQLISRSQAKRVLARVEQFTQVIFDFTGVDMIGQAFADQIFRVFAAEHPEVELISSHANHEIAGMIHAARKMGRPGFKGALAATD